MQTIVEKAKITSKGQITLPKAVRQSLGARAGDVVLFAVDGNRITVHREQDVGPDPAIEGFLEFLARDIREGRVVSMPDEVVARMKESARDGNLDEPIEGDVAL